MGNMSLKSTKQTNIDTKCIIVLRPSLTKCFNSNSCNFVDNGRNGETVLKNQSRIHKEMGENFLFLQYFYFPSE